MNTRVFFFFMLLAAAAGGASAGQQEPPQLQLPPPTAATPPAGIINAQQAQAPASSTPAAAALPMPAQAPASVANALVLPAPVTPAASVTVAPASVPAVAAVPVAAPKVVTHRRPRPAGAPVTSTNDAAIADLHVPKPAYEALQRSTTWANNDSASVSTGTDGRVVFTFGETMPTVICAPLRVCDIELQPGEKVLGKPAVGDPRFSVTPAFTGSGESLTTHVIVKPREKGLDTNLIIATDRRMYRVRLVSDDTNYVSVVSWDYPDDDAKAWDSALADQAQKQKTVVAQLPSVALDSMDFNFTIKVKSGHPEWIPTRVFTAAGRTFIQFPDGVGSLPAPVVKGADGNYELVNFHPDPSGKYYVIDRVFTHGALVGGVGSSGERVEIDHACAHKGLFGGCKDQ
jgi:type IV secretion system protein VirB9